MVTGDSATLTSTDIWINGGFFVMRNEIFSYIKPGEELVREPFQRLIEKQAFLAYKYTGFWQCMDTFKDKQHLEELNQSTAPWKVWNHGSTSTSHAPAEVGHRLAHDPVESECRRDRSAADSVPGLPFGRHRDRLRWHDPPVG